MLFILTSLRYFLRSFVSSCSSIEELTADQTEQLVWEFASELREIFEGKVIDQSVSQSINQTVNQSINSMHYSNLTLPICLFNILLTVWSCYIVLLPNLINVIASITVYMLLSSEFIEVIGSRTRISFFRACVID